MIAALDVHYRDSDALAACVVFEDWGASRPHATYVERVSDVAPYEPGAFFRRELPCLLRVLARVEVPLQAIVVDGYVWLSREPKPGLGSHLYEALGKRVPVIGVAKTAFVDAPAHEVHRGTSARPLYVTAAGVDAETAAKHLESMHGPFRLPTMLRLADQLSRARGS